MLHGILRFDGHPSVMIGFLRNIKGIGLHIRIGDWICSGCTNNNYASREKCKKCGQSKEVAAMPALAMPGASLQTHPHYFARIHGVQHQRLNLGPLGNGALQQSLTLSPNWPLGGPDKFGVQPLTIVPFGRNSTNTVPYANHISQVMAPKGWRNGDWICTCGFHNYKSRAECKKCTAAMPPALGTKRLASEDLVQDWDNKRLNAGQTLELQQTYLPLGQISSSSFLTPFHMVSSASNQRAGLLQPYPDGTSIALQLPQIVTMGTVPGKGAKQWRDGDWMCTKCDNHNYASRSSCNKCNTQKEGVVVPVSAA
uniref:Zinc finger (Ran-binding) family protein n=1 Tax=Tanacetum cinerariifolium TaxID=118510 RepID=A0A6L2NNG8_TANCI|nr:zinc finger (Ran-binding) family protein [Tanacetum cinerariifolium]